MCGSDEPYNFIFSGTGVNHKHTKENSAILFLHRYFYNTYYFLDLYNQKHLCINT